MQKSSFKNTSAYKAKEAAPAKPGASRSGKNKGKAQQEGSDE
jgi:hypothetical protein